MTRLSRFRVLVVGIVAALLVTVTGPAVGFATAVDTDLESGLAYLKAGNNQLAALYLARYGEKQSDALIRRQVDMTIARLDSLTTAELREQAARELQIVALHWRFRNFPVFP
jgi:hypothetical protein